ncbi:YjcZ family sporulation protein [Perspicuibacillus lycopersici]
MHSLLCRREVQFMGYSVGGGSGSGFALIVVLFILLVIVGAAYLGY